MVCLVDSSIFDICHAGLKDTMSKLSTHKRAFLHVHLLESPVLSSRRFCRLQFVCSRQKANRKETVYGQERYSGLMVGGWQLQDCDQRSVRPFGRGSLGSLILVQMKGNWCSGRCLSCSGVALTLEPSGHLVGNWELEVRWLDFNRELTLTEPGNVEKRCNPTLISALWMLAISLLRNLDFRRALF